MSTLSGMIALVTGGSRGIGKGTAVGLAEAGARVYVTGRTVESASLADGCIPIRCDHTIDEEVERVFELVIREQGRLDILVNNAWGGYENNLPVEQSQHSAPIPRLWINLEAF